MSARAVRSQPDELVHRSRREGAQTLIQPLGTSQTRPHLDEPLIDRGPHPDRCFARWRGELDDEGPARILVPQEHSEQAGQRERLARSRPPGHDRQRIPGRPPHRVPRLFVRVFREHAHEVVFQCGGDRAVDQRRLQPLEDRVRHPRLLDEHPAGEQQRAAFDLLGDEGKRGVVCGRPSTDHRRRECVQQPVAARRGERQRGGLHLDGGSRTANGPLGLGRELLR